MPSALAEATVSPSGAKATDQTRPPWPLQLLRSFLLLTLQMRMT